MNSKTCLGVDTDNDHNLLVIRCRLRLRNMNKGEMGEKWNSCTKRIKEETRISEENKRKTPNLLKHPFTC